MAKKSEFVAWYDDEAAKIRKRYAFSYTDPLDPYMLVESLGIKVIEPSDISGISWQDIEILRSIGTDWSGLSFSLPHNRKVVILNPFHDPHRKRITLMEEICHLIYGHKPQTRVRLFGYQKINFLEFSKRDEKIAYRVAASVLVPYKALESLIMQHKNLEEISFYFGVSPELVEFRLKTTGLFQRYKVLQKLRELLASS